MPLYDYRCADCGDFRALRPMADSDRPAPCPTCGTAAGRRLVAPFLGGRENNGGGGGRPLQAAARGGNGNWRHLCGLGCRHCA